MRAPSPPPELRARRPVGGGPAVAIIAAAAGQAFVAARRFAPLAQSAEHSHGKAGVVGSIPTGGSGIFPGQRPSGAEGPVDDEGGVRDPCAKV